MESLGEWAVKLGLIDSVVGLPCFTVVAVDLSFSFDIVGFIV